MKKEIQELVQFAINSKNSVNKKVKINTISKIESQILKLKTDLDVEGFTRILDKSSINHTISKHGNDKIEKNRGQIAVVYDDFYLIPKIVKTENIIYSGKTKTGTDCILYQKVIGDVYYYVEEVRKGKKELCLKTLYKRKATL